MSDRTTILPENILRRMKPEDRASLGKSGMLAREAQDKFAANCEKQVHKQIENWLRLRGIFFIHSRTDKKTTNAVGTPDFVFAWNWERSPFIDRTTPVAVEVKVNGNKLSDAQKAVRKQMIEDGWNYNVVDSLPQMLAVLNITRNTQPTL